MATFYNNLRQSNKLPIKSTVRSPQDIMWDFQVDSAVDIAEKKKDDQERSKKVKETAPLRKAIREASGGRVIVDKSIYDDVELGRILDSVKDMQEQTNGALPAGYSIVMNSNGDDMAAKVWGFTQFRRVRGIPGTPLRFSFPNDYFGDKNAPYRIRLRRANNIGHGQAFLYSSSLPEYNVMKYKDDISKEKAIEMEDLTHAHELAHTAYLDALKKTQAPELTFSQKEREKRENFRNTHASLQELFDIAAKNTGYKNVEEAAASVSGYSLDNAKGDAKRGSLDTSKSWRPGYRRLSELFAEAYTDYFSNKEQATDYSKELIRLFSDYINDYNKTFNDKITLDPGTIQNNFNGNSFINNLRKASR